MLTELLREERLSDYLSFFEKDKKEFVKTRVIFGVLFALIGLILAYMISRPAGYALPLVLFVIGYKYPYYSIMSKKNKEDVLNSYLFPEFVQVFIALIPTSGNVYQTLLAVLPYTKDPLRKRLEALIEKLQEDNNREYYLEFADYINSSEAYMVMDMIYQFSEFGIKKESLKELQTYMDEIQKNRVEEIMDKKMASMEVYGNFPIFLPMITVGGFAVILFLHYFAGVTSSLGGM